MRYSIASGYVCKPLEMRRNKWHSRTYSFSFTKTAQNRTDWNVSILLASFDKYFSSEARFLRQMSTLNYKSFFMSASLMVNFKSLFLPPFVFCDCYSFLWIYWKKVELHFFFKKNLVYKNIKASNGLKIKNILSI